MEPLRVLVAEDAALVGLFLADVISGMGYEICTVVDNEAEALTAATQYRPDLIVFDVRLGQGSGIAAVAEILRSESIPYLFITGSRPGDLDLPPGAVVLQKPFFGVDLALAMQHALRARDPSTMAAYLSELCP